MGELACNTVSYRPDQDLLAAKFRSWHVETLLDQAATLISRCLVDFSEYSSLDYAWHQFQTELETQEKKLGIYLPPEPESVLDLTQEIKLGTDMQADEEAVLDNVGDAARKEDQAENVFAGPGTEVSGTKSSIELRVEAVQRKKELSAPGGPFALHEQRDLALKRLCRDYEGAVDRACVAEEGLKKLYGYTELSSPLTYEAETLGTSITNLSAWIRDSVEWLAGYSQLTQSFTRVVSVRALLNRNAWALLKHSRDSYSIKLQVPADLFRGFDNCRLRSIGASLIGEAGTVPWSIMVRLPDEAVYERSGQSVEVDQSRRTSCLLGRVENRRSAHPIEACGVTSLINASPIGRSTPAGLWSLEIIKPAGATSESFSHVEDVVLEINVVGTPLKSTS